MVLTLHSVVVVFQSTHPVRGATVTVPADSRTRPISIHAPREGCDAQKAYDEAVKAFQSTPP